MAIVGIIGGLGPESTIEYYRQIISAYEERDPNAGGPPLIINSVNMKHLLGMVEAGELEGLVAYLSEAVRRLASAGAQVGLISAVTPHIVFDAVQRRSPIPLISIVETACEAAEQLGITRAGLLGTRFTMQGRFYPEVFQRSGIRILMPRPAEQDEVHEIYFEELVKCVILPATRKRLLAIVQRMIDEDGIQALVLGGTELSLLVREPTVCGIPVLDSTKLHVERAVTELLR